MFFVINNIQQAVYNTLELQNPKKADNPMSFRVYRRLTRTALFSVHSKKAFGEFRDEVEGKNISTRFWTQQMKAFAAEKVSEIVKLPYIFKFTILGWIFCVLVVAVFTMLIYNETKPPVKKPAEYLAMEASPLPGDIYFGHFEAFNEPGKTIASNIGFGWFIIVNKDGDNYYVSKSTQMNKTYRPKEELNNTDFESEHTSFKIIEQTGFLINMKSVDGKTTLYITDKK